MGLSKPLIVNTTTESVDLSALETAIADVKTRTDNALTQATNAATYASNVNSRLTTTRAGYLDKLNTGVPTTVNGAIGLTGTSSKISAISDTTLGNWSGKGHAIVTIKTYSYQTYQCLPTIIIDGVTSTLYNGNTGLYDEVSKAPLIEYADTSCIFRLEFDFDTSLVIKAKLKTDGGSSYYSTVNVTVELK